MDFLKVCVVVILTLVCNFAASEENFRPKATFDGKIRKTDDGRFKAYMIPPYKTNHASFLELLPNGDLLLAWFSGTKEGRDNVSIVISRLKNGTDQWNKAELVARREGYSNQNPVLFFDNRTKLLHLFHSQQPATTDHLTEYDANVWTQNSTDLGMTWSPPYDVFSRNSSFDRNRVFHRLNGEWAIPMYYAVKDNSKQYSVFKSTTDGIMWNETIFNNSFYLVQPSVIRPQPGKPTLVVYYRDRRHQNIYKAVSADDGATWTAPQPTSFPNNNAGIQARALLNQHIVIVYNPTHDDRHPLRISLSEDGGITWPYSRDLESGPGPRYSYPCILQTADEYIHVSYTYNRDTIKYVKFMEDWIKK
jgi:predicted neuraminidase